MNLEQSEFRGVAKTGEDLAQMMNGPSWGKYKGTCQSPYTPPAIHQEDLFILKIAQGRDAACLGSSLKEFHRL